jgi:hypothetical protein
MDQVVTGTVQGNTIVLDGPIAVPDGHTVEIVVRDLERQSAIGSDEGKPPAWWTKEDDRILDEIHRARKRSTRPEAGE